MSNRKNELWRAYLEAQDRYEQLMKIDTTPESPALHAAVEACEEAFKKYTEEGARER